MTREHHVFIIPGGVLHLGIYDRASRTHRPVKLPGAASQLRDGRVVREPTSVELPQWSPEFSGTIRLAARPSPSHAECLQQFRAALEAACNGRAPLDPVESVIPAAVYYYYYYYSNLSC